MDVAHAPDSSARKLKESTVTGGVVEARPGIIETSDIHPLNQDSNKGESKPLAYSSTAQPDHYSRRRMGQYSATKIQWHCRFIVWHIRDRQGEHHWEKVEQNTDICIILISSNSYFM